MSCLLPIMPAPKKSVYYAQNYAIPRPDLILILTLERPQANTRIPVRICIIH